MITIAAMNINNPAHARGVKQADWLIAKRFDVICLSEVSASAGSKSLALELARAGYALTGTAPTEKGRYSSLVASRVASTVEPLSPKAAQVLGDRVVVIRLGEVSLRLISVYGVSSDPYARRVDPDRVDEKRRWLRALVDLVSETEPHTPTIVVGDLNIVEPATFSHYSRLYQFEHTAYADLLAAGYTDLVSAVETGRTQFTWISPQGDGFRYDHLLCNAAARRYISDPQVIHDVREGPDRLTDHSLLQFGLSVAESTFGESHDSEPHTLF
ncbi:endonuclease/exonuclease/phosphatase family protein [Rhodococcus erythropolis]|uniref:endonuclease/exonuclease/phosphatase family protein n=1 Tax=Rhodococcus erythropolis TaxID=1833 RepID=UPI001BE6524D|nr:endonuclease/exonuclease/phosphatase family protein [Rhodococcus erythropolis]MBT2269016.1 endonuclease/exonuclease/phosphatase family protein [Rhodococcus erythropolis]